MASLTPGVLSKLLDNVGNRDAKVTGEHRSALLQVIEILPCLGDEPLQSQGYFLKVSDSLHCAYVSICEDDLDLIYNDKIQLGQFVYVGWLDAGLPVPVLCGLKPVPKRRACVGSPKDLLSSDLLQVKRNVNVGLVKESKELKSLRKDLKESRELKSVRKDLKESKELKGVRKDLKTVTKMEGKGDVKMQSFEPRRLSLDSARKAWDQKSSTPRSGSAARGKSKNGLSSAELAFIQSNRKVSSRDDTSSKCSSVAISPLKNKNGITSPRLLSKPLEQDSKLSKPQRLDSTLSSGGTFPDNLRKVPLSFKTCSDRGISWEALPTTIHDLGKDAVHCRNDAFLAAVQALEEASAFDSVINCMSAFAELCESSQKVSAQSLVMQFLEVHQKMRIASAAVNSLIESTHFRAKSSSNCRQQNSLPDICKSVVNRNAVSWILAAVDSDLSKFSLYREQDNSEIKSTDKRHYVILESTSNVTSSHKRSTEEKQVMSKHKSSAADTSARWVPSPCKRNSPVAKISTKKEWLVGAGLKDAAYLAEKLLSVSREWFLKYLEDSLKTGFRLSKKDKGCEFSSLLGQLKRVNQWLDELVHNAGDADGRIDELKKKIYGFLLEHVNSAFAAK